MSDRAQVRNAADADQVKRAGRRDRHLAEDRTALLATQLSTYAGRQFVWQELERHAIFQSITVQSSLIYAMSGRRDAGLELLAEVQEHTDLYLQMQAEAIHRAKRSDRETDAAHTPSATAGEKTNG
jgi:hypothetical protein